MEPEVDNEEAAEIRLGPAGRARIYRQRAAALADELEATSLPRLKEKLSWARDRFTALAEAEERLLEARARLKDSTSGAAPLGERLTPILQVLIGGSAPRR